MKNVENGIVEEKGYKLFNFRAVLFAAFFLMLGIYFSYRRLRAGLSFHWLWWGVPVALLPILFCKDRRRRFRRAGIAIAFALCFMTGFISFRSQAYAHTDCTYYRGQVIAVGTVENKRTEKSSVRVVLQDIFIQETREEGKLVAYLPLTYAKQIQVADRVVLQGYIATDTETVEKASFSAWRLREKIRYTMYCGEESVTAFGKSGNWFLRIRARMEGVVYEGMTESAAAVTLALLTGDTAGMEEDLTDNMRYGGIIHIFAVSGLNVGALYLLCLFLFSKTGLRRAPKWARFLCLLSLLFLYSGICGFSASVVRAAVFCAVAYFVKLLGTGYDLLNALGGAACFILLLSPCQLFDVGFQLSFAACIGLFLLAKPIGQVCDECYFAFRKRFPKRRTKEEEEILNSGDTLPVGVGEKARRWCVSLFSASLGAQIATLPLLLVYFGYASGWALLLNLAFVPLVDAFFTLLLIVTTVACLLPAWLASALLYIPSVLWSAGLLLFETVDFSSFALTGVKLSGCACVCYYVGITFLSDKWNLPKGLKRGLALVYFLAFFLLVLLS